MKAAGTSGSRRLRRIDWVLRLSGATLLVALAWILATWGDRSNGRLDPALDSGAAGVLERMALVFPSEMGETRREPFFIDRYEVTNREFGRFVRETGYRPSLAASFLGHFTDPLQGECDPGLLDHPVVFVSLEDARAYAAWGGKQIPTADEWTRVARETSTASRYDLNKLAAKIGRTARVGTFESGSTRHSRVVRPPVYDLFGNVAEWTVTRSLPLGTRVVKGGSFIDSQNALSVHSDASEEPANRNFALGFRCVIPDATAVVRRILLRRSREEAGRALAQEDPLERFGEPMARLLHRIRFEETVRFRVASGGGDDDFVVPLDGNRLAVLEGDGWLRVFDVASGRLLAEQEGFSRFYHGIAADLDGDGKEELYLATVDERPWAPEFPIGVGIDRQVYLLDSRENRVLPWCKGTAAIDEVTRAAFELDSQEHSVSGAPLFGPWGSARFRPVDFQSPAITFAGFTPRLHQVLQRVDVDARGIRVRWRRSLPYSAELIPLPETGELLVPGLLWRRYQFLNDYQVSPRVLDARVLRAEDGGQVVRGLVPGGCLSIQALDRKSSIFHVLTTTQHELLLRRRQDHFQVDWFDRDRPGFTFAEARKGPAPFTTTMLSVELVWVDGPTPTESGHYEISRMQIRCRRDPGDVVAEQVFQAAGTNVPRLVEVPGFDRILVVLGDKSLLCLDRQLETVWRTTFPVRFDPDRAPPVFLDADRDGRPELVLPWRLDGFVLLDPRTGAVKDRYLNPGPPLLRLSGIRTGDGPDRLLVAYRGEGVVSVVTQPTPAAEEAQRLLDRLDPLPGRLP